MATDRRKLWVNGRLVDEEEPCLTAVDRGFTLGDGLFETMLAHGERVFRLDDHLERLYQGSQLLAIVLPSEEDLAWAVKAALWANDLPQAVVRLTVSRGYDAGRGLDISLDLKPTVVVRVSPHIPAASASLTAIVSSVRRNEGSPLSTVKALSYADKVLARQEARARGAEEALMLSNGGLLAGAAAANVFLVRGGVLLTPSVQSGALPGITRRCILELAEGMNLSAQEAELELAALQQADEVFLTNSVIGVRALVKVDGQPVGGGQPGPVTRKLAAAYARLQEDFFSR